MDLSDFRMILALAERQSFTRAARDLGLTQPAVSTRLKNLEAELGTRLVYTAARSVRLTDAGEAFVAAARKAVLAADAARDAVYAVKGLLRGKVALGASTTPGVYLLPGVLGAFRAAHPEVGLSLRVDNTLRIEEEILSGELDLGVVGGHLASRELERRPFVEDRIVLFAGPADPLARKRRLSLDDVLARPFVMRERGSATRSRFEQFLAETGRTADVALEFGNPEAVKRAVEAGAGLGVMSRVGLVADVAAGRLVELLPAGFDLRRQIVVVTLRGREPAPAAAAVLVAIEAARP